MPGRAHLLAHPLPTCSIILYVCVGAGIESAFMSTTFDREVAMHYAQQPGKPALVFEMQLGMIDRGAELGWISQYPYEAECLFAPLTGELRLAILFILRLVLALC